MTPPSYLMATMVVPMVSLGQKKLFWSISCCVASPYMPILKIIQISQTYCQDIPSLHQPLGFPYQQLHVSSGQFPHHYNICMPSLKQQGNEAFKERKFKEAAKYYEQYVQQQHPDNKNAYFNLGLCYSKLHQHIKSIQACKNAVALDQQYDKAYYRLMKEYDEINNHYEVFANAHQYIRISHEPNSELTTQARQHIERSKFKLHLPAQRKRLQDSDDIFGLIEPLAPALEGSAEFNEQVDKYPSEWIEEWQQGIQSQDAKWEEIAYITREINPQYGLSLAYYYYNQNKHTSQGQSIRQKIKELRQELGLVYQTDGEDYNNTSESGVSNFEQYQQKEFGIVKQENIVNPKKNQLNVSLPQVQAYSQSKKINKIKDLLQSKANIKKNYEQNQKPSQLPTNPKKQQPLAKPTTSNSPVVIEEQKTHPPKQQKKQEQMLEQLYQHYCGKIQKSKDIFNEVYRSIFQILQGKQNQMKGKLLILLKKRVKKLKVIVASFSDNEQRALFDLLRKTNMQEYAVDFAPNYYTL